jgi:hypothetical protein
MIKKQFRTFQRFFHRSAPFAFFVHRLKSMRLLFEKWVAAPKNVCTLYRRFLCSGFMPMPGPDFSFHPVGCETVLLKDDT